MTSISCVVTAPEGLAACSFLDDLLAQTAPGGAEVLVVDGSESAGGVARPGVRLIPAPGSTLYGQMAVGLRHATHDWVLVLEDHGRPMPGLLQAYRSAIDRFPAVDLFGGALENVTSTSPWSFAYFLYGSHEFWPAVRRDPVVPSNANLMVRRTAVLHAELASDTGFMFRTRPRLVREGRYHYCADAVVDHIVNVDFTRAVSMQFHTTRRVTRGRRTALGGSPLLQVIADVPGVAFRSLLVPARLMTHLRGTPQARGSTFLRLIPIGLAAAVGVLAADAARLADARTTAG